MDSKKITKQVYNKYFHIVFYKLKIFNNNKNLLNYLKSHKLEIFIEYLNYGNTYDLVIFIYPDNFIIFYTYFLLDYPSNFI